MCTLTLGLFRDNYDHNSTQLNIFPLHSLLDTIYDNSRSKVLKMVEMKNEKRITYNKPDETPNFLQAIFFFDAPY